jgi:8-oxo-dGTP diphosphatase
MEKVFRVSVKGAIISDHKVLLLKRANTHKWELPGGTVEHGESIFDALKREMREETGLQSIHILQPIGNWDKVSGHETYQEHRIVLMYQIHPDSFDIILSEEHTEYQWIDRETLELIDINENYREHLKKILTTAPINNQSAVAKLTVGVILRHHNHYLLLQRSPQDHSFQLQWQFVVGAVEAGQNLEQAACREVFEETGIDITEKSLHFQESFLFGSEIPGEPRRLMTFFMIDLETKPRVMLSEEHVSYDWVKIEDLDAFDTVMPNSPLGTKALIQKSHRVEIK